jgi:hypothetical protein
MPPHCINRSVLLLCFAALIIAGCSTTPASVSNTSSNFLWYKDVNFTLIYQDRGAFFDEASKELLVFKVSHNLTDDEYVDLITFLVQRLPAIEKTSYTPEETLHSGGDCDDKSILLAGLLSHEGYAVALLLITRQGDNPDHVAVGIKSGETSSYDGTGYMVLETIATPGTIGFTPYWYHPPHQIEACSIKASKPPIVVKISDGIGYTRETVIQCPLDIPPT